MIQARYLIEIERTSNGWVLREIEEKPSYGMISPIGTYSDSFRGMERNVRTFVYPQEKFLDMLQHVANNMRFGYEEQKVIFITDEMEEKTEKRVIHS